MLEFHVKSHEPLREFAEPPQFRLIQRVTGPCAKGTKLSPLFPGDQPEGSWLEQAQGEFQLPDTLLSQIKLSALISKRAQHLHPTQGSAATVWNAFAAFPSQMDPTNTRLARSKDPNRRAFRFANPDRHRAKCDGKIELRRFCQKIERPPAGIGIARSLGHYEDEFGV